MRLDFLGKTLGKISVSPQALKKGQKDLVPAVTITVTTSQPNNVLDKLDPSLKPFLFQKAGSPAKQGAIDVVPAVSDLPELTTAAQKLGSIGWGDEQTGCSLVVHQGATGQANITLKDGKVDKVKLTPKEGGAVETRFNFYSADLDAEAMGQLGVLHKHEVEFELVLPKLLQKDIEGMPTGSTVTPLKALKKADEKARSGKDAAAGAD